ncbi:unnamed protein product [Auanema sp. JU1783]|nr:unnamed protein product [Auanema sp. JU1783]
MGGVFSTGATSLDSLQVLRELEKTRIERELALLEITRQRQYMYELANEREQLNWLGSGGLVTSVLSVLSSYHHKNLIHLLPIVPIATYLGYKAHSCYGNKHLLINETAQSLMKFHDDIPTVTPLTVEDVRAKIKELREMKYENDL